MSDVKTRSFTMRLSAEDQAALVRLCEVYGLDRPTSIRRAIRQVLAQRPAAMGSGDFMPVGRVRATVFSVHVKRKSMP